MASTEYAIRELEAAGFKPSRAPKKTPEPSMPAAVVVAVAEPEARAITPRSFDDAFAGEYLTLASELEVSCPTLQRERETVLLERMIAAMGLRVYDRAQVTAYLTQQYGIPRPDECEGQLATWGWRPLRARDNFDDAKAPGSGRIYFAQDSFRDNGMLALGIDTYSKPIPMPVLLTVKEIVSKHPTARFFVSDELSESEARDPFLLVKLGDVELIIERWDEPNYRER